MVLVSCKIVSDSVTPWTAACQAPPSFTISQSWLRFISTESVMLSKCLILCLPPSRDKKKRKRKSLSGFGLFVTPMTSAAKPLCPWNSPGHGILLGSRSLLQGILYHLSHPGKPKI